MRLRTGHGLGRFRHILAGVVVLCCLSALAARGASFEDEWKAALARPIATNEITGPWQGAWTSKKNGDSDKLRCLITKISEREYQARFRAHYWKIFRFSYTVVLRAAPQEGEIPFQGDANLGWYAGGNYHYAGKAGATNFFSTYKSKADFGEFQLRRPAAGSSE